MKKYNKEIGKLGESIACQYLINNNYLIKEKNFHSRFGEIDIIGIDNNHMCFIEVKTRYNTFWGNPMECVNYYKQKKIIKTAKYYIFKNKLLNINFRFDVLEVFLDINNDSYDVNLVKDAFRL